MDSQVHVCIFEAVGAAHPRATYRDFRAQVLKAGRFSAFEATENQRLARLYDRLAKDPTLTLTPTGFPWTRVEKRRKA